MSTESETKSAGVPAGATHVCIPHGSYWRQASSEMFERVGKVMCPRDCSAVPTPIAEAGPAPTTAAPVEQLSGKVVEGQPPRECAFCDTTEVNGVNINECSSCLTLCCTAHSEDADNQRVLCINCAPEDEPVPAEQPGKAADPRPAQPQAPAEPSRHWPDCALNHGGKECDMGPECGAAPTGHTPAEATLREERDRLAAAVEQLAGDVQAAAEDYTDERAKVAERDARITTLTVESEEHDRSATRWAHMYNALYRSLLPWLRKREAFLVEQIQRGERFLADGPTDIWEAKSDSGWNVNADGWRKTLPEYAAELAAIRAALGAPEGQPRDYDPMTSPVPEGDMNGPHGPIPAPEGQPPAAPSEAPPGLVDALRVADEAFGDPAVGDCRFCEKPISAAALCCEECAVKNAVEPPEAPLDALRRLIDKWEQEASEAKDVNRLATLRLCARELRAALSAPPPPTREKQELPGKEGAKPDRPDLRTLIAQLLGVVELAECENCGTMYGEDGGCVECAGVHSAVVDAREAMKDPPASAPPRKAPQEGCKACALVAKEFGTDKCPWCGRPFGTTVGYVEKCSAMHHAVRSAMGLDKPAYDARPSSPEEQLSGKELK